MKKIILLASLSIFLLAGSSYAGNTGLFTYDKSAVNEEMALLNELELYVLSHPGTTLAEMVSDGNPLAMEISNTNSFTAFNLMYEKALGIGGFWWGCCLGPVGILVVYLVSEDKAETRSAIIGCVVGTLLYSGSYAGWYWGLSSIY